MKAEPDATVVGWLHQQSSDEIWTSSITVFEIHYGLSILPTGKRKRGLVDQFELALKLDFDGRILDFDADAAIAAAEISANFKKTGQGLDVRDAQIAGIAVAKDWTLATRNVKDFRFAGVKLVDPRTSDLE